MTATRRSRLLNFKPLCYLLFVVSCLHGSRPETPSDLHSHSQPLRTLGHWNGAYKRIQTPLVKIGPCLGAKVEKNLYAFVASCLYAGPTRTLRLEFVEQQMALLTVDSGQEFSAKIEEIFLSPHFDPVSNRENLRQGPQKNWIQGENIALIKIDKDLSDIPKALLGDSPLERESLVMVSSFGCITHNSTSVTSQITLDKSPTAKIRLIGKHDPAHLSPSINGMLKLEGTLLGLPHVTNFEPLCHGAIGSPVFAVSPKGLHLIGLGIGRLLGGLLAIPTERNLKPNLDQMIRMILLKTYPQNPSLKERSEVYRLSCTQTLTLMPDNGPREYRFADLGFALVQNTTFVAASETLAVAVEPHDRPPYMVQLDLVEHCTKHNSLCFVGIYRDPVTAGVQAMKLEVSLEEVALAHWISSESGAKPTPLDPSSCQLQDKSGR